MKSLITKLYVRKAEAAVPSTVTDPVGTRIGTLADAFAIAMNVALGVGISLTVIFLIMGGIQYMTSKGDQKAAQEARTSLTNAIIGLVVVVAAFAIKRIVLSLMGASVTGLDDIIPGGSSGGGVAPGSSSTGVGH